MFRHLPSCNCRCCLMLDAMSIKKAIEYDQATGTSTGFVNLGNNVDSQEECTEALVFMVVGLTGRWKAPVAYFLTHVLSAATQHQLVLHTIQSLAEIGMQVCTLTMDGHATNTAMCGLFGCQLDPSKHLKTYFYVDGCAEPIFVIMDACHMIKLVRNMLQAYKSIKTSAGNIEWKYIQCLHNKQQDLGLRFANKLSQKHLDFHKQKMKVNLAVQTISNSVAKALELLQQFEVPGFDGCDCTIEFIKVF